MELRQLKYFEAVARTLNFSRAAEELYIAQPPLSRQIQNLESELGVVLIDRSSRPLKLTNAGAFFYEQSIQIISRLNEIKKSTQRLGSEKKRWMGIGFVPSILYSKIPRIIKDFTINYGNINTSLIEITSVEQADALKSGRIDIGFGRLAINDQAIENVILYEENLIVAISGESPLSQLKHVSLKDIINETLILYPSTSRPSFADQVIRQFKIRGLEMNNTYDANSMQTAIGLVAVNMGVSLVPESAKLLKRPDITYIKLSDAGVTSPVIMSTRVNDASAHIAVLKKSIEQIKVL